MKLFKKKRFDSFEFMDDTFDNINCENVKYIEIDFDGRKCEYYYNIIKVGWVEGMFMIKTISEIVYLHPFSLYGIRIEFEEILNNG